MKKLLLFFALFVFAPQLTTAQEVKNSIVGEKVTYSRAIPKALRAIVPSGGKSRFWGATKLQFEGKQIWAHVYDVSKTDFTNGAKVYGLKFYASNELEFQQKELRRPKYGIQEVGLDLFVINKSGRWKRLYSTYFMYVRYGTSENGGALETVGIETFFLNPSKKDNPVVKIDFRNHHGFRGDIGVNAFVVFDRLLKNNINVVNFGYGLDNSSDGNSWSSEIGSTDEKGFLKVMSHFSTYYRTTATTLQWDGFIFVPTDVKNEDHVP